MIHISIESGGDNGRIEICQREEHAAGAWTDESEVVVEDFVSSLCHLVWRVLAM